jgi:hypothetical protein
MDAHVPLQTEHSIPPQDIQKGPILSRNDQKWESLRQHIYKFYITENNTLSKTMLMTEEQHDFKAS